jgi:ubiquinone/menaquinone biosynthesis C-methylase UbiE
MQWNYSLKDVPLLPENINDKGYRRMLSKKHNFLEFIKQHIAAPWAEQLRAEDMEFVNTHPWRPSPARGRRGFSKGTDSPPQNIRQAMGNLKRGNCMKIEAIDKGNAFDFGSTSLDYSKYRDIYPNSIFTYLIANGIGKKDQKVLDLATGTGALPRAMYKFGAKYIGIDISNEQIKQAIRLTKEQNMNIEYKVCPAESTELLSNDFDVITAVQCFIYFDRNRVLPEIKRLLKANGKFVVIWMTWLPYEDRIAEETEKIVRKYNSHWTGFGYKRSNNNKMAEWVKDYFIEINRKVYNEKIQFTYETWAGRIRACRGISAALPENIVKIFNEEHLRKLKEMTKEPFEILHEIEIGIYKKV